MDRGAPLNCPACGVPNDPDTRYCENCGSLLNRACTNCGAALKPGVNFCSQCGVAVKSHPSPQRGRGGRAGEGGEGSPSRLSALQRSAPADLQQKIRRESLRAEGERKPVTILFSDIVGSTSLAEKLDPEEWREIVNGAHRRVSEAVHRYEGTIAQLLGDGVLAFFGAPVVHEDDPVRAVRAALEIQEAIHAYEGELAGYLESFQMRIGIHSGTVVVGAVGDDLHMEYLAIGDAVNLAARLQSAAEPGKVLISEHTARLLGSSFSLGDLGEIQVKGKAEPLRVFDVQGVGEESGPGRGVQGLESPLVGRDGAFTQLIESLRGLEDGLGGIVFVLGEAGIGKSRLVEEAHKATEENYRWLEGRALSYGQSLSYWSLIQLLQEDLGLTNGDPQARVRVALRRRMETLFGERAGDHAPYLSHLLGLRLEEDAAVLISGLDGETLRHQTIQSLGEYFNALAADQPSVLVFEDVHWADASTMAVLEELLALTDRAPLVFLFLGRLRREHPSWALKLRAETDFSHRYREILLEPLSKEDANTLVNNLLAITELPNETRQLMLTRADGNPFYLEELIRSLIDTGGLVREGDRWVAGREITVIEIPENLQGVLLARIDRLEEDVRRTLQLAAVIGKSFLYRLLEAISEAERELDRHLSQLQRVDLVREKTRRPELEYIFKHSLIQEAAYNSLLLERRRKFHLRVGEALENLFGDRHEEYLGLLAHHFDRGGDLEKATGYLLKAGDKARLEDAQQEAAQYYRRAIELLEEQEEDELAAQTWLKLGMVYHIDFRFEKAHQANQAAFRLQKQIREQFESSAEERSVKRREEINFKMGVNGLAVETLDPAYANEGDELVVLSDLFAGIADLDPELNMVPRGAISWEVFDGGRRYLIHLRDDLFWTDGSPVTASDYEWAWKRNLRVAERDYPFWLLDDIRGARDYRMKHNEDPDSVGVRAVDEWTLEIMLNNPVAYFPYVLTQPVTYPLPRAVIERYGDDWWHPENLVSNGPYQLAHLEPGSRVAYKRNPFYPGTVRGNLTQVEWVDIQDDEERASLIRLGELDYSVLPQRGFHDEDLLPLAFSFPGFYQVSYLLFAPVPPLDDPRVRRALSQALDRGALARYSGVTAAHGGLVPAGMAGHSPGIGLPSDLPLAQRLMAEAGYSEGKGFPEISGRIFFTRELAERLSSNWREGLGIEVELKFDIRAHWDPRTDYIYGHGWIADYPDPDNFLRRSSVLGFFRSHGWQDAYYDELVNRAAETPDRARRMAMYRQADRYLVSDQALVMPLSYGYSHMVHLNQPWVRDMGFSPLGPMGARFVTIDPAIRASILNPDHEPSNR